MKKKLLLCLTLFLSFAFTAMAQTEVSGTITDENGEPLLGASVVVKGTSNGTTTDFSGNYKLTLDDPSTAVLLFKYIGYKDQEMTVGSQTTINVQMALQAALEEVVVTGYREQERVQLTGSIAVVDAEKIDQVPMASFDQILQGQAPGVMISTGSGQPGAAANVRIRGLGSIGESTDPLYVVDGVPISAGDFETLNPNDFATINVLKDASAVSVYGSRGANGVILITTKRGQGKGTVKYRTQMGMTTRTQTQFTQMNTQQKHDFEKLLADYGYDNGGKINAQYLLFNAGSITQDTLNARIAPLLAVDTDWTDVVFRDGRMQMHELVASGGTERGDYYVSANYRYEEGIVQGSGIDRYTLRLNLNQRPTPKLSFGVNTSLGYSTQRFLASESGASVQNPVLGAYISNPYESVDSEPIASNFIFGYNPQDVMDGTDNSDDEFKIVGSVYANYEIMEGLTLSSRVGLDFNTRTGKRYDNPNSPQGGVYTGAQGRVNRSNDLETSVVAFTTLTYDKVLDEGKHKIQALIGNEIIDRNVQGYGWSGYGVDSRLGNTPAAVTTGNTTFLPDISGYNVDNRLLSFFFDGNYVFNGKYGLSAGIRRDASTRFAANKTWATFWSVGATWNITEESFAQNLSFLDFAKLRASYGTTGNQETGDWAFLPIWVSGGGYNNNQSQAPANVENPDYGWEVSNTFNVGLDFAVLDSRLSGTVEYYNELTTDLFVDTQLSRTTGFSAVQQNVAQMRNSGVEVQVRATPVKIQGFTWNLDANVTFNKNRIEDLFQEDEFEQGTAIIREGLPLGAHYVVDWAGVDPATGDALYYDINGNITTTYSDANRMAFGTWDPPRFGGFTNRFTYENESIGAISLSAFFSWAHGHTLFNNQRFFNQNLNFSGIFNQDVVMLNIWTQEGQVTDIPRPGVERQFSSRDLEDGSFMRLRNVQLTYDLPSDWLKSTKAISALRIYFMAQNLATWTKFTGFDPENNNNIVLSRYPVPRTYLVGLDVTF